MKILSLEEASKFCKVSKEAMRQFAVSGDVRGVKLGKCWRFVEEDLIEDVRRLYGKKSEIDKITGKRKWVSISNQAANIGESDLQPQPASGYNALLKRLREKKPSNSMTRSKLSIGEKNSYQKSQKDCGVKL